MSISISIALLAGIAVYIAVRYLGLSIWHAVLCMLFGFLLASTGVGPEITSLLSGLVQWAQVHSGGTGVTPGE